MINHNKELEIIANNLLDQAAEAKENEAKPNYSNRDFMNTIIIFQTALMDKMFDYQSSMEMDLKDRLEMTENCGKSVRNIIILYTGLDTHELDKFL